MPMETFGAVLSNSSVVENNGKVQYVLEYTGEKNFTIVEEVAESEETTQTIIMSGSLVDGLNMVGRYDGNHMTSVIDSVQLYHLQRRPRARKDGADATKHAGGRDEVM